MSSRVANYLDAIQQLPEGAVLVFHEVSWDDYEDLLDARDAGDHRNLRISYDRGRLQIVSPRSKHEKFAQFIGRLLHILSDELDVTVEGYGITTWKRKRLKRGAEADNCFYVASAERVMTKDDIDLEVDPPPDIVVEIDISNDSLSKFPIYAALQVPEIWRYNGTTLTFFNLWHNAYREVSESRFLTGLKPAIVAAALEQSKTLGQTAALRTFRREFRKHHSL